MTPYETKRLLAAREIAATRNPNKLENNIRAGDHDAEYVVTRHFPAIDAGRAIGLEAAAAVAHCHSDDRPRRDSMNWNDGYIDGCRGAATAIRALKETAK